MYTVCGVGVERSSVCVILIDVTGSTGIINDNDKLSKVSLCDLRSVVQYEFNVRLES
jgi:hypothetical protein